MSSLPPNAPGGVFVAGLSVFIANMALLVLQLVAPRQLAPAIGSSLETWTTIIGVFLAGIALGNWVGGTIADRSPTRRTLGIVLAFGGVTALGMVGLSMLMDAVPFYQSIPLGLRIPLISVLLCLPPAFVLSLITPLAIKIALPDLRSAGRIAGLMFALSTLGCLLGNYLTGFVLIASFNVNTIAFGVAAGLFILALGLLLTGGTRPDVRVVTGSIRLDTTLPPRDETPEPGFLRLAGNLRLAYAIVFLTSFCGMTLELTGFRHLAPHLGVSLYTWTGIIGVMLAATATGNYVGGLLADRGLMPALRFGGALLFGLVGAAASHAVGTELLGVLGPNTRERVENWGPQVAGAVGEDALRWGIRFAGFLLGVGVVRLGAWLAEAPGGLFVWAGTLCGLIAPVVVANLATHFPTTYESYSDKMDEWSLAIGLRAEPWVTRGVGVLIGLAIAGAFRLGQRVWGEERVSGTGLLGGSLILGSVTTLFVVLMTGVMSNSWDIYYLPLVDKVLTWTFGLFFLPMFWLGTVSPQVIRLSVTTMGDAGKTAGRIYAWSTFGAIAGTFATGYLLISLVGVFWVLMLVAAGLLVLGTLAGHAWRNTPMLFLVGITLGGIISGLLLKQFHDNLRYDLETNYYAIRVNYYDAEDNRVTDPELADTKHLQLDRLLHSVVKVNDPKYLHYTHEHAQVDLVRKAMKKGKPNILVIGGGGYTFPRYLELEYPGQVNIDVVEIDPGVTEIAHRLLGLPRDTSIRTFNMDGRQFIEERAQKGHYDLVIQDAVNDLSVPYHLMTKQYNDAVRKVLKPDGAYLLTFIDSLEQGRFWRAAYHTMTESFPNVSLLGTPERSKLDDDIWSDAYIVDRRVYVIYGSMLPFDPAELPPPLEIDGREVQWTRLLPQAKLNALVAKFPKLVLTDQYAPVDNLMAEVFRKRERGN